MRAPDGLSNTAAYKGLSGQRGDDAPGSFVVESPDVGEVVPRNDLHPYLASDSPSAVDAPEVNALAMTGRYLRT
jgi:hypothetical protein